jgi:hypothetical protein
MLIKRFFIYTTIFFLCTFLIRDLHIKVIDFYPYFLFFIFLSTRDSDSHTIIEKLFQKVCFIKRVRKQKPSLKYDNP